MTAGKIKAVGKRAQVMHGTAHHTSGGLTKADLKYNKHGKIVSRKKSAKGATLLKRLTSKGTLHERESSDMSNGRPVRGHANVERPASVASTGGRGIPSRE